MKITAAFVIILSLTSLAMCQKAFDQVRSLIVNFRKSIEDEQQQADVRRKHEIQWCKKKIAEATEKLRQRQHDVDSLKAHIKYLQNEKTEHEKDRATRQARIKKNLALLKKFKKERCDANLIFVKNLREHMEAIEVLGLLRTDIVNYFAKKAHQKGKKPNTAFIERFAEFSHLLDEENKMVFAELQQHVNKLPDVHALNKRVAHDTAQKQRTAKQVGTGHIDNKRGALKRLETPDYETTDVYFKKLRARILAMIDGLVAHLKASRDKLTHDEIRAAEDFAKFQYHVKKENKHLRATIARLTKEILEFAAKIKVALVQLKKRVELRDRAKRALEHIKEICRQKKEYYEHETKRRNHEISVVRDARKIFEGVLAKLSARIRARANANIAGRKYKEENKLARHVVKAEPNVSNNLEKRVGNRNGVVF